MNYNQIGMNVPASDGLGEAVGANFAELGAVGVASLSIVADYCCMERKCGSLREPRVSAVLLG
jgi:hypothetical protein